MQDWKLLLLCTVVVGVVVCMPKSKKEPSTKCSAHTCGAIDPVNDPAYNIRNVITQTILLEEHLAEERKYCKSCIIKHYLHIQGLLMEAIWMAGHTIKEYPYLEDAEKMYTRNFEKWHKHMNNKKIRLEVLDEIRAFRQKLIGAYFLNDQKK
jgi:hypothetical protein